MDPTTLSRRRHDVPADLDGGRAEGSPRGAKRPRTGWTVACGARRVARRLGPVEWWLLVVILLAVGVTVSMAIFNPG